LQEFDFEMAKVDKSLGFTLRKEDDSRLGHYVLALVKEPAISDGRIRPGDKIVAVSFKTILMSTDVMI
jgi:C-terminal processing protease CtpA/Prc